MSPTSRRRSAATRRVAELQRPVERQPLQHARPDQYAQRLDARLAIDDDDDVVQKFAGQMVEVTGEIEGDVKTGEIKAERENGMIELEIDAAGRKATVKVPDVPSAIGSSNAVSDREKEIPYFVQKLDVKTARSVASSCR